MAKRVKIGKIEDRLAFADILLKNGYTARLTEELKDKSKPNGGRNYFVEYWEGGANAKSDDS